MKTILAHWKKDIISSRAMLTAWAICVALAVIFFFVRVAFPHPSMAFQPGTEAFPKAVAVLFAVMAGAIGVIGVQMLLLTLLVIHVIHLDPLTVPDAFWRTRPISGGSLLTAKSLFVAMLLLGAFLSVGTIQFDQTSKHPSFLGAAVFILGVVAFASITSSLPQLILNWLAIAIGSTLVAGALLALSHSALSALQGTTLSLSASAHVSASADSGPLWLTALYLVGFLSAVLCQYFTLRTNLSRAILITTFFLATLLQ